MELLIIRHAQSTNNAGMLHDPKNRVYDPALTDLGHQQARALAHYLCEGQDPELIADALARGEPDARRERGFKIDRLYCSPMHRSLLTAHYIYETTGVKPHVWVDIHEHGGVYQEFADERGIVGFPGRSRQQILDEFPDYEVGDQITDQGWWTGAMEDITTAYGRAIRVAQFFHALAEEEPDQRIAIVSHGTFMDALLKALLNQLPSERIWYYHYNTAMTQVNFRPTHVAVRYINRVAHLTPDLLT